MLLLIVEMLKKKLGAETIERDWSEGHISYYYKIPTSIIIPEGCKKVGCFAFLNCWRLKKVVIPGSVKSIEVHAFNGCYNLREVVIPGSVEYIGDEAFWGCKNAEITIKKPESRKYSKRYISPTAFKICKDVKEETRN